MEISICGGMVMGDGEDEFLMENNSTNGLGPITSSIQEKITAELAPKYFQLINESAKHASGQNNPAAETHFTLVVVAAGFQQLSRVERHRLIYKILGDELQQGVHALSLQLYTDEEWQQQDTNRAKPTPPCTNS